jgi:hypothetical protein
MNVHFYNVYGGIKITDEMEIDNQAAIWVYSIIVRLVLNWGALLAGSDFSVSNISKISQQNQLLILA